GDCGLRDAVEADAGARPLTGHRGDADDPSPVVAEVQALVMDGALDPGERAEDIDVEDLPGGSEVEGDERPVDGGDAALRHEPVEIGRASCREGRGAGRAAG